jgi:hypothetical protein
MWHRKGAISSLSGHPGSCLCHYTTALCQYAYSSILTCHPCDIHHLRVLATVFCPPGVTPIIELVCVTSPSASHLPFWSPVHYLRLIRFSCLFQTHPTASSSRNLTPKLLCISCQVAEIMHIPPSMQDIPWEPPVVQNQAKYYVHTISIGWDPYY